VSNEENSVGKEKETVKVFLRPKNEDSEFPAPTFSSPSSKKKNEKNI
jgi:hypothetical protein